MRLAVDIANELIFQLDLAQEDRRLSPLELDFRKSLKSRLLGYAAIDRARWRQKSRMIWIKAGDANTKLFHLRANGRRRKNHMPSLQGEAGIVKDHSGKEIFLKDFFVQLLGERRRRDLSLDFNFLGIQRRNLEHLDARFSMEEIKTAVFELHAEKAPGPDGFVGAFFKKCWHIIASDLVAAIRGFHDLRGWNWHLLNSANLVLLPKKDAAAEAKDFRPVSLMHGVAKIVCKILASRLAPELQDLISISQSAFIKRRCIHDNFLFVQSVIKNAHVKKKPMLFFKLDIAKAFDSVHWEYLLEVLEKFGFGSRWRDMVALMLSSSSSRVLLNGIPGAPFKHMRGLRQGDPLSPMLFILAMEPLQAMFAKATDYGILSRLENQAARLRLSLYADDVALFMNPVEREIDGMRQILHCFGRASGLLINYAKCSVLPISCHNVDLESVLHDFGGTRGQFPCSYLGLPLGLRKPTRIEVQPLIDKMSGKLKTWKGKLLSRQGRLTLI